MASEGKAGLAVSYLRVSTDDQGLGLEAQRSMIAAYCAAKGLDRSGEFSDEGVSGGAPMDKRPGLLAALGALRKGGVLVVAKRDRLSRDPFVAIMAERMAAKAKASVACADGNGNGDGASDVLMRRMLDAFAEFERAQIAMRTRAALSELRRQGRRISGRPPFGFRFDGGRLVEEPSELGRSRRRKGSWRRGRRTPSPPARLARTRGRAGRGAAWRSGGLSAHAETGRFSPQVVALERVNCRLYSTWAARTAFASPVGRAS
ncbi:MAG: recombinase family protein [Candidatus Rokubacteria bacterium]|nr:recombinase family protein [Candidatus Rokubacteria bacterium]